MKLIKIRIPEISAERILCPTLWSHMRLPCNVRLARCLHSIRQNRLCSTADRMYHGFHMNSSVIKNRGVFLSWHINPSLPSLRLLHRSSVTLGDKPCSRFGKLLRESRIYRGERKGCDKTSQSIVASANIEVVEKDNSLSLKESGHVMMPGQHMFDEEYFGNIIKALTEPHHDGTSYEGEDTNQPSNLFDHQYFESVTEHLTRRSSRHCENYLNRQGDGNHARDENRLDSAKFPFNANDDDQQANLFDQLYFGNASLPSNVPGQSNLQDTSGNIAETIKLNIKKQHFPDSGFELFLEDDKEIVDIPKQEKSKKIKETVSAGNVEVATNLSMDTFQTESAYFWQDFLRKEAGSRAEETPKFDRELERENFNPAEKAETYVALDNTVDESERNHSFLTTSSGKGLPISRKDRIRLEAEREILERAYRSGADDGRDLEPTVGMALQASKKRTRSQPKTKQELKIGGTPDPSCPISEHSCSGCGALLHCQEESRPGYMPSEKFKPLTDSKRLEDAICQRCWYFIHHKHALNVNVNVSDYKKIISAIKSKKAHILVMVDLTDFPCSVIPNLKDLVGSKTPMFIVGNKFDLLPKDDPNYHKRVEKIVLETCIKENVCDREQVAKVHLISAKTGFGVEKLITLLQNVWGSRKDIYLLGTANIGKSTLFTTLLNSDFSKTKASHLIKQPTISQWPGTTLNLLKFPILRPTRDKVMLRNARLKAESENAARVKSRNVAHERSKIKFGAYVNESVGRSYSVKLYKVNDEVLDDEDKPRAVHEFADPFTTTHPNSALGPEVVAPEVASKKKKKQLPFRFTPMEFESGKWFYDTMGVLHDRQVLTHLTMDELKVTMANRVIIPRTLIIKPGQVVFLGGLGRLDYVQGAASVYLTVFASEGIPVRYCDRDEAVEYYRTHAGEDFFKVPIGGAERMKTFPKLLPTDLKVVGCGWQESASDILLSSVGWIAVTAGQGMDVQLRAFTPAGHGCFLRHPALLPFAVNMKGRRVSKQKPFYQVNPKAIMKFR